LKDSTFGTVITLDKQFSPFSHGVDLFVDKSIIAVSLEGHCVGHMGIIVHNSQQNEEKLQKYVFFVGDACWSSKSFQEMKFPHWITKFLVHSNWNEYTETISKLNQLSKSNADVLIVPSHCLEVLTKYVSDSQKLLSSL